MLFCFIASLFQHFIARYGHLEQQKRPSGHMTYMYCNYTIKNICFPTTSFFYVSKPNFANTCTTCSQNV